ncbi:hypothetical protein KQI65_02230 [bacterium]|nr:hypothetical protein [bacterium]
MIYFVIPLIILVGILAYFYVQNHAMHSMVWKEVRQLAGDNPPLNAQAELTTEESARIAAAEEALPEPVRRYFARCIAEGRDDAVFARLRHGGSFRTKPDAEWLSISGEEYFNAVTPGFVWMAVVKAGPLAWVRARDKYIGGKGEMLIRLRGALTLGLGRGREMDESSLIRYLSELPWLPTAFRAVEGLQWEAIDADSAAATLTDSGMTVRGIFHFNADGEISRFETGERYREMNGSFVRLPWICEYRDYREVDGMRIPHDAEVNWVVDDEPFSYARFQLTSIEYDLPAPF